MNNYLVYSATNKVFSRWHDKIKHTTRHFGFREYIKDVYGFTYSGSINTFNYKIVDEQKFMIFVLKYVGKEEI